MPLGILLSSLNRARWDNHQGVMPYGHAGRGRSNGIHCFSENNSELTKPTSGWGYSSGDGGLKVLTLFNTLHKMGRVRRSQSTFLRLKESANASGSE